LKIFDIYPLTEDNELKNIVIFYDSTNS